MSRLFLIVVLGESLALCIGCDQVSSEHVSLDRVEATQYSRDDLVDLVWRTPVSQLLPALTTVNRRDHPYLGELLLAELRALLQEGEGERATAIVQALGWCGWDVVDQVRVLATEFADLDREHRLAATELLRLMGNGEAAVPLRRLTEDDDQDVARAAKRASMDLFGTTEPLPEAKPVPGSTPWVMRCVAGLRTFVLTSAGYQQRFKLRKTLTKCPSPRRLNMYRILVRSCALPLEEFPGRVEMESIGTPWFLRRRLGQTGQHFVYQMVKNSEYLGELSSALLIESSHDERTVFWRLLADPLALGMGDNVSQQMYDDWIEYDDLSNDAAFYFVSAFSRRTVKSRRTRELELAATVDWERRLDEKYLVHSYVKYLDRVMDLDGLEIHRKHRWKDPCEVDISALRVALSRSREFVWNRISSRFEIKVSGN